MKKLIALLVAIGAIYAVVTIFKSTDKKAFLKVSQERVENMWSNMQSGGTADLQDAIGYWYVGHPITVDGQLLRTFEKFIDRKGIPEKIGSYAVVSAELVDGDDVVNRFVRVVTVVNGETYTLKVPHKFPIEWLD